MNGKLARDIMTRQPATCTPDASLFDAARLMVQNDCGAIPVVETGFSNRLVGIITDRDIACRGVARAENPYVTRVAECMTKEPLTVRPDTDLADCRRAMERKGVRRLLVTDDAGACLGIISQADLAVKGPEEEVVALVKQVSRPPGTPSRFARAA